MESANTIFSKVFEFYVQSAFGVLNIDISKYFLHKKYSLDTFDVNSCYLQLLIFQNNLSETRIFTLRYR